MITVAYKLVDTGDLDKTFESEAEAKKWIDGIGLCQFDYIQGYDDETDSFVEFY